MVDRITMTLHPLNNIADNVDNDDDVVAQTQLLSSATNLTKYSYILSEILHEFSQLNNRSNNIIIIFYIIYIILCYEYRIGVKI